MSISQTVRILIEQDPPIQDSIERGYANCSAIARILKNRVERILGNPVSLEGLVTAVKRYRTSYGHLSGRRYQKIIAESVINLRTDVAKISLKKSRRNLENSRLASADFPEFFFQILEGDKTLTLITDRRIFDQVKSIFNEEDKLEEKPNLAAVIVQSPKEIVETPGCIAALYNPISRNQINIEETISCFTETIIILRMDDAANTFKLLTDIIANARNVIEE